MRGLRLYREGLWKRQLNFKVFTYPFLLRVHLRG